MRNTFPPFRLPFYVIIVFFFLICKLILNHSYANELDKSKIYESGADSVIIPGVETASDHRDSFVSVGFRGGGSSAGNPERPYGGRIVESSATGGNSGVGGGNISVGNANHLPQVALATFSMAVFSFSVISYFRSKSFLNFVCDIYGDKYNQMTRDDLTTATLITPNNGDVVGPIRRSGQIFLIFACLTIVAFWIIIAYMFFIVNLYSRYPRGFSYQDMDISIKLDLLINQSTFIVLHISPLLFILSFLISASSAYNFVYAALLASGVADNEFRGRQAAGFGVIVSSITLIGSLASIIGLVWQAFSQGP